MRNDKEKPFSPAIELINLIWEKSFTSKTFSWRNYNAALQDALKLAIASGMRFDLEDFQYIAENYRFGYWGGIDGKLLGERYYAIAVMANNIAAAKSFEAWKKRKPFISQNVKAWNIDTRKSCRLHLGSEISWKGEDVTVTSFSEDGKFIIACSYKERPKEDDPYHYTPVKIKHKYKISNSELRKELKWLRKCDEVEKGIKLGSTFHHWIIDLFNISVPKEKQTKDCFFRMFIKMA